MKTERFDFDEIVDQSHFFRQFSERFALNMYRIGDLDALWDVLTGEELPMPLEIEFINLMRRKRSWRASSALISGDPTKRAPTSEAKGFVSSC